MIIEMNNHTRDLISLLKMDVVNKSEASCLSFILFATFIFFYQFGSIEFGNIIRIISLFVCFISLTRIYYTREIIKQKSLTTEKWKIIVSLIWLNALSWSVILNLASFELKLSGIHFIVVTTFMAGLIGASIVTLSNFSYLFIPFQSLILLPQIGIILYYHFSSLHVKTIPLIFLYLMYVFYQIKQFKDYRQNNLKRFKYQIDLEEINKELQKSKDALVDQTVKLVQVSKLAALGELSAGIAHEINNPLMIIQSGAKGIEKSLTEIEKDNDYENLVRHSQKIQKSISRINSIVKGLKSLSTLSENHTMETVALSEIIEDTKSYCMEVLNTCEIKLIVDDVPGFKLKCHPVQISQVLINLINNAKDFILENVESENEKWIKISFENKDEMLKIKVSNCGEKIKDDIAKRIFEPFFTTKAKGVGTGLGLSISTKIMQEHEGELRLDHSEESTTFIVNLPLRN